MDHFIEYEIGTKPLSLLLPTATGHEKLDRAAIDANTRKRISGYANKFKKQVKNAISDLYLAADAQDWDEKHISDARKRLEDDIKLHLNDFTEALKRTDKATDKALTEFPAVLHYREMLGAAAMLHNELAAITDRLDVHLMLVTHMPAEKRA